MKPLYLLFAAFSLLIACTIDDPEPGLYDNGVLVTNEGNFGSANGTITFISEDGTITSDAFGPANEGRALGDVVQSIYYADNKIFVVVNNSHILYALNEDDLSIAYEITETTLPRYMTHHGNIGYFTEWIETSWLEIGANGQVKSFDLTTGEILDSASVGHHPEYMATSEERLYVSNSFDATVSILDISDLSLLSTLTTPPSPGKMVTTSNKGIVLICGGGYDANYSPLNDGAIVTINGESIVDNIALSQTVSYPKIALSPDESIGYYFNANKVWSVDFITAGIDVLIEDSRVAGFYGIAVAGNGTLYLGDHAAFQGIGNVLTYTPSGEMIDSYPVGIAPNGFLFR